MKDICLVVPSIREGSFKDFFDRWNSAGLFSIVDLMLMEDNPLPTFDVAGLPYVEDGFTVHHLSWANVREDLGEFEEWIIPRGSDTVRSFAYWKAWKSGYKFILTLDDDCYPCTKDDGMTYTGPAFVNEHLKQLLGKSRWFNTLNSVKPRGVPFYNIGNARDVIVNHGLWTNVIDYDAPSQLANPAKEQFTFDNRVVPSGLYFPMCGMNVMWRADATVLMYHLLMGNRKSMMSKQDPRANADGLLKLPFDRFGDIWCGIIMKKIADHLGLFVSTGMPYVRHERASNPFTNLKKEANGIEVNEKFWEFIDGVKLSGDNMVQCYGEVAKSVQLFGLEFTEHAEYFSLLGEAMAVWASLFDQRR